jgi:hypothetical protein
MPLPKKSVSRQNAALVAKGYKLRARIEAETKNPNPEIIRRMRAKARQAITEAKR